MKLLAVLLEVMVVVGEEQRHVLFGKHNAGTLTLSGGVVIATVDVADV